MAQSRLEKIGTIYTRVTGLIKSGALKSSDRPVWYDVYKAFPPKIEPRFDRPDTNIPIRNIFYEEDTIRAKFHKDVKHQEMINLFDNKRETQTQHFIKIYRDLQTKGGLEENKIFETSLELLEERKIQSKPIANEEILLEYSEEPIDKIETEARKSPNIAEDPQGKKDLIARTDINDLFKK